MKKPMLSTRSSLLLTLLVVGLGVWQYDKTNGPFLQKIGFTGGQPDRLEKLDPAGNPLKDNVVRNDDRLEGAREGDDENDPLENIASSSPDAGREATEPEGAKAKSPPDPLRPAQKEVELEAARAPPLQEPPNPGEDGSAARVTGSADAPTPTQRSIREFLLKDGQVPEQSPARPLGLDIVGEVEASVWDPGYVYFITKALPVIEPYLDEELVDWESQEDKTVTLELEHLRLKQDANVRVYFIKEGTAWQNSVGIVLDGEKKLIFPNASSASSFHEDATTRQEVTNEQIPLLPGDYVDLGIVEEGELLDLFLIQDGARRNNGPVFYADKESNPDNIHHIKIHELLDGNTLIIGFEDLPLDHELADQDYNDVVIALEINPLDEEPSANVP